MDSSDWFIMDEDRASPQFKIIYPIFVWLQQESIREQRRFLEEHPALQARSTAWMLKIILSIFEEDFEKFQQLTQIDKNQAKELFERYKQVFILFTVFENTNMEYIQKLCRNLLKVLEIILVADDSAHTIRKAFVEVFGGIVALDIPSWLEHEVESFLEMRRTDRGFSSEEAERWQNLIQRAKQDENVPQETIAELLLMQISTMFGDTHDVNSARQALQTVFEIFTLDRYPIRHARLQETLGKYYKQNTEPSGNPVSDSKSQEIVQLLTDTSIEITEEDGEKLMAVGIAYLAKTDTDFGEDGCELAIRCFQSALKIYSQDKFPEQWAICQFHLGMSYSVLNGRNDEHRDLALSYFQAALHVFTLETFPERWATVYLRYMILLREQVIQWGDEDRVELMEQLTFALGILTREAFLEEWARGQMLLGYIAARSPGAANVEVAENYYKAALEVFQTDASYVDERAMCYVFLGELYINLEGKLDSTLCELAIQYFEMALPAYDMHSQQWAGIQMYLGRAYHQLLQGIPEENNKKAINCYVKALEVFERETFPRQWALIQNALTTAYMGEDGPNGVEKAVMASEAALLVYTRNDHPEEWAQTQQMLGLLYLRRESGEKSSNIEQARRHLLGALQVFTQMDYPQEWAKLQYSLSLVYWERFNGEAVDNIEQAIRYSEAALRVYTPDRFPFERAGIQVLLISLYDERIWGEKQENQEKALLAGQMALKKFSYDAYPIQWASTQSLLANIYEARLAGTSSENLACAIECHRAALRVHQLRTQPELYRLAQLALAHLYGKLGDWQSIHDAYSQARAAEDILIRLGPGIVGKHQVIGHLASARDAGARMGFALVRLDKKQAGLLAIESGQARVMAATLARDAFNPMSIRDAELRERYIRESKRYADAQRTLHRIMTARIPEDEFRLLHISSSELVRIGREALEKVLEEVSRISPLSLSTEISDSKTIMQIVDQVGAKHALVYLMATPWGGMAVAVCSANPASNLSAHIETLDLPQLDDRVIAGLLHVGLTAKTRPAIGGFIYAQQHGGFGLLVRDWNGVSFRGYAEYLHDACMLEDKTGMLDQTAQDILQDPDLAHIIDQPLRSLPVENLLYLMSKFDSRFLKLELERVLDALATAGIPQMVDWLVEQKITSITVVPCGWLATLPLAAVPCRDGQTLGEHFAMSIAPNAQSLQQSKKPEAKKRSLVYTIGNPYPTPLPLKWSEAEAYAIARLALALKQRGGVKVGEEATRQWLIHALQEGYVVDASCHGEFDQQNFLRSALCLANRETLTLGDMLSHRVDLRGLRLFILSACRTASADVQGAAANEVKSLAVGMLQAGAQAVLATLWPVDDYATFILMVYFAQIWLPTMDHEPPAKALAQAQRWMRTVTNKSLREWRALALPLPMPEEQEVIGEKGPTSKEAQQEESTNRSVADIITAGVRSYRSGYYGERRGYDINQAQREVTMLARMGDPDARPFADPIYWAGFQITGW